VAVGGCDPYAAWPEEGSYFPYIYTPEVGLEPYEEVRWETETWDPADDLAQAGQYLLKLQSHRRSAPVESLQHFEAHRPEMPPLGAGVRLSFVGDIMWLGENWSEFALPVADLLDGDLRIGNLETPTSPAHPTEQEDLPLYTFNAPPEILDSLPLDVVQLNNNHSVDVGEDGLEATLAQVEARGWVPTGVDRHAVVEVGGLSIAFLSYTWGLNGKAPPVDHELFVVPFGHVGEDIDLTGLGGDIADARATGADTVVLMVHWGFEYEYYADPHFMVLGREMVALGADLVVGTGPHVAQPAELCQVNDPETVPGIGTCSIRTDDGEPRTAAILYSLGNFDTMQPTLPVQTGLVATVSVDPDVTGLGWEPIVTVRIDTPRTVFPLADIAEMSLEHAAELERLEALLGTSWKR
jgi:poly-gamma-glutamate synthesis protein (capsule biosynthesis protein)